jgi:hypothetical protein
VTESGNEEKTLTSEFWSRNVDFWFPVMPPTLPPLSEEEFLVLLQRTMISGQDIRALMRCTGFLQCDSCNTRLLFLYDFSRNNCSVIANNMCLSLPFVISPDTVAKSPCQTRKRPRAPGGPLTLAEDEETVIVLYIRQKTRPRNFVTWGPVLRFVEESVRMIAADSWLRSFLSRHADEVHLRVAKPQENPRLQPPRVYLDSCVALVGQVVLVSSTELVFNVDKSDLSDWEECKKKM